MAGFYENNGTFSSDDPRIPQGNISPIRRMELVRDTVVNVVPTEGQAQGPLADLFKSQYQSSVLSYPRDSGAPDKHHEVQFDIRDISSVSAEDLQKLMSTISDKALEGASNFASTSGEQIDAVWQNVKNQGLETTATNALEWLKKLPGDVGSTFYNTVLPTVTGAFNSINTNFTGSTGNALAPGKTAIKDTIRLYMPDTLSFGYQVQYDKLSLAEAGSSLPLVGGIARAITSTIQNPAARLLQNKMGYAFNPQQQVLFEGIDFREYDMTFVFTPTSVEEAYDITKIIKTFRKHAAPTIVNGLAGFFFTPPSVFDISFYRNGIPNEKISPIRTSVITNINVDYAPNGWSAMVDGMPAQTILTLSFREIDLVDRTSIEKEL